MKSLPVVALVALTCCTYDFAPERPPTHIDIREDSISIPEGQSLTLAVDVDNCAVVASCIAWVSTNECVASVFARTAHGGHFGSAVVRAIAWAAQSVRDSVQVTVTASTPTSLRFVLDSISLLRDSDYPIRVRFYDAQMYELERVATFRSQDTSVARLATAPQCDGLWTPYTDIIAAGRGTTFVTAQLGSLVDTVRVTVQ